MKEKNYSLSLLRILAVISIILCHSFEYSAPILGNKEWIFRSLGNYLANGVQIFFLMSGFLYGSERKEILFSTSFSRINFFIRNSLKVLKDYWIYCILVIFPVYYFKEPALLTKSKILGVLITSDVINGVHHLWFISYILFCYLITPYLFDIKEYLKFKSKKFFFLGLIFLIIFLFIFSNFFKFYFFPEWILCYIIGFFLFEIKNLLNHNEKIKMKAFILFNFFTLNILRYYLNYIAPEILSQSLAFKITLWSQVFFAIVVFLLIYGIQVKSSNLKILLNFSDKYSYNIYLAHMIYIKEPLSTIFLTKFLLLNYIITFFLSIISGVLLYCFCRKIENFITLKKEKK